MSANPEIVIESGAVIDVPLNKLRKSPRNARRTPHTEAAIEALAASIGAKGVLQAPVVEPETDGDGQPTGFYLVTIGEGRRLALRLLAKRKRIKKTEPVRCVVDLANDPHEISLDENVTRTDMHPADQFEAFRRLSEERGLGAEEIGARFGVSAHVVRQRLRLGAVSPVLMAVYREDGLTLDHLMAFAVGEDHARQEQVFEQLTWNRSAHLIRRAMTEEKIAASDRRAIFVGAEAYAEAGGRILRDLFTEDGGGWLEDVALLEGLAAEKLEAIARDIREQEGWKWAEAHIDYPHAHGVSRVYPHPVERSAEDKATIAALGEAYDALLVEWDGAEELSPEVEARFAEIDAALQAYGDGPAYDPDDLARGGAFVVLDHNGHARVERGLIRLEDAQPAPESVEVEAVTESETGEITRPENEGGEEPEGDPSAPLPDRLVMDLTAHRTLALRNVLASDPTLALTAVVHSLTLFAFYGAYDRPTCVEVGGRSASLEAMAPGIADSIAGRQVADRHEGWAKRLPKAPADLWGFVSALSGGDLLALLAHITGLTVNAVRNPMDRKPGALAHADVLAEALELDMTTYWSPTASSYLGRVTKAKISEAVTEGVSPEAAARIADLKKGEMVEAAAQLLEGRSWLPKPLRRAELAFEPVATELEAAEPSEAVTEAAAA